MYVSLFIYFSTFNFSFFTFHLSLFTFYLSIFTLFSSSAEGDVEVDEADETVVTVGDIC